MISTNWILYSQIQILSSFKNIGNIFVQKAVHSYLS